MRNTTRAEPGPSLAKSTAPWPHLWCVPDGKAGHQNAGSPSPSSSVEPKASPKLLHALPADLLWVATRMPDELICSSCSYIFYLPCYLIDPGCAWSCRGPCNMCYISCMYSCVLTGNIKIRDGRRQGEGKVRGTLRMQITWLALVSPSTRGALLPGPF